MSKTTNSTRARIFASASAVAMGLSLLGTGGVAWAQDADEDEEEDRVVVTGSRIQRQDFTANSPIVTIDTDTFENTSTIGIETVLNQLPQFVPALFTQFNSGAVEPNPFATPGASNVNLRGLGPNRTLTLVNGRRAIPLNAQMVTDTNSIPSSAIQRVEIISGGASAVYGADALAGVVNFILKDDFEGLEVDTQYGITELGDNEEFRISALVGANVANGRGNVMLGVEHSTRGFASWNDRDWYVDQRNSPNTTTGSEFWFSETYWGPGPFSGSGHVGGPDQAVVDSLFPAVAPGAVGATANFFINPTPDGTGSVFTGGHLFGGIFGFAAPGTTNFPGSAPSGAYKYTGPFEQPGEFPGVTWRKTLANGALIEQQLANYISTPLERYSMFGSATFDVTDNITLFVDTNYAHTRSQTLLQYSPANNNWGADIPYGTDIYAPSLAADGTTTLAAYQAGGAFGLNCPATGGCTESQAFPVPAELAALLDSRGPFANDVWHMHRNMDYLPRRQTINRSSTFQITAGLQGELPNDWFWDISASHGEAESLIQSIGFASLRAYLDIVTSPNYGRAYFKQENVGGHGTFAAGGAACSSGLPIVQEFEVSDDCVTALSRNMQETSLMQQSVVEGNLTGDLFELPAGTLQFAVGASYRENVYEFQTDPLKDINSSTDQAIGIFPAGSTFGALDVREIYGELLVPIISDVPFIQALNLELGGRYSDYDQTGGVETFKVLGDWSINEFARIRGGYNKASRAANIGELYQARTTTAFGAAGAQGDPCSPFNSASPVNTGGAGDPGNEGTVTNENGLAGAQFARQVCNGLMGAGQAVYYADPPTPGAFAAPGVAGTTGQTATAGNPNLDPETADTWTVGAVLSSPIDNPFLSGLRLTVDYFNIQLDDYITTKAVDDVYIECLSSTLNATVADALASQACSSIQRQETDGSAAFAESFYINSGGITLAGVDVQLDWSAQLEDLGLGAPGGLSVNMLATIPTESKADFGANAGLNYVGFTGSPASGVSGSQYDYRIFTTFNYFAGDWSASLRWQHYPGIDGGNPANPNATSDLGSYNLFGLSGSYRLSEMLTLRAGVENLFDTLPPRTQGDPTATPFALAGTRNGGGTYDPFGRRFFLGAQASF